ncbi:MAG: DNA gyrase/topoisomerase IV subunit A [Bacteroidia bacterium]|nr:DNA gyrase/topoisomerase IV subunit A [Bacteroidota bacterium]MBK9423490.1 DNA gyrase/topoisomerase IV subunit A [Bacteroidota bacterium]MBP9082646.1 DNA gyrase/topoisomerase IV subunit A [Bacteroidia bacterium]
MSEMTPINNDSPNKHENPGHPGEDTAAIAGMYKTWFLDYASYVILERAVPYVEDGLKPVQRRILHSMFEMEDGRYNKVANIIGNTMKYHPHGDASIGDALVQIGQKNLLIDTQGNWGNVHTGDSAAAPRYIEARLSKFALEVVFNPKTTVWQLSYDGRNREPVTLPVKFPLLLAMGVEGIAVGLASKVLPHNFIELIQGSIDVLKGKKTNLMPDFATGGVADFSNYKEGLRGGRIRIRSVIEKIDKKTLVIKQIPYGTTTTSVIESILAAVEKGKIKIKKVEDNTASEVEIVINLHPEASQDPDKAIEALYAFSNCEVSISPNSCIIEDGRPRFLSVNEILEISTRNTVDLLKLELEIARDEKETEWHYNSLEKIFIEKRIYRSLEVCETWDQIMDTIEAGLKPYLKNLRRPVVHDDYVRLTELKIKRISRYDANRAEEKLLAIEAELAEINDNLNNLKNYAINYFKELLKKFGKGRERRTVISSFETIVASKVIANNQKLYVNREEGFAGYGMKRDEFLRDCSDLDDVIAITGNGKFTVTKIAEKAYVGKDLRHIDVFSKNDETTTYNMIYQDGKGGAIMVKRFFISGITRDKVYDLTKGAEGSKILYLGVSGPTNGPRVNVHLKPRPKLKNLVIEVDFNEQLTKNRSAIGNVLTKFPIAKLRVMGGGDPGTGTNAGSAPNPAVTPKPVTTAAAVKNTAESTDDIPKTGSNGKTQIKLEF